MAEPSSTITFRPVTVHDATFLSERLAETFTNATPAQWRTLFKRHWEGGTDDLGTVALLEERIVGFFGVIPSVRPDSDGVTDRRNFTAWWIDPTVRGHGIGRKLVHRMFAERPDALCSFLTLPDSMMDFWRTQPVVPFDLQRRAHPWVRLQGTLRSASVRVLPRGEIPASMPAAARRILLDHLPLRGQTTVFEADGGFCGVITRRRSMQVPFGGALAWLPSMAKRLRPDGDKRGMKIWVDRACDVASGIGPYAEVFYVSDKDLFRRHFHGIANRLCRDQRAYGVLGDADRLGLPRTQGVPVPSQYFYLQREGSSPADLDALYSEFFLLPLGDESR